MTVCVAGKGLWQAQLQLATKPFRSSYGRSPHGDHSLSGPGHSSGIAGLQNVKGLQSLRR